LLLSSDLEAKLEHESHGTRFLGKQIARNVNKIDLNFIGTARAE
jgi:hypothetical protein